MHIPDNYLSPSTCAVFGIVMLPIWRKASLSALVGVIIILIIFKVLAKINLKKNKKGD